jgi:methionine-rich copper-binding protein CopC
LTADDAIATGDSKVFSFTMKAPGRPGTYTTDWKMVKEGGEWFGGTCSQEVTVRYANDATIVSNTIPDVMAAGQYYTVSIAVQNAGNNSWTKADLYRLGAVGDSDPFATNRLFLGDNAVASNGQYTFTFTMRAPSTPGTYTTDWRMLKEGSEWFGEILTKTVTVVAKANEAEMVSNTIPTHMSAGSSYLVSVTVKNAGATTWTETDLYRLGAVDDSDPFAVNRQMLASTDTVAPGEEYTFSIKMTAPTTTGIYTSDWQMVQKAVNWFGDKLTTNITVE